MTDPYDDQLQRLLPTARDYLAAVANVSAPATLSRFSVEQPRSKGRGFARPLVGALAAVLTLGIISSALIVITRPELPLAQAIRQTLHLAPALSGPPLSLASVDAAGGTLMIERGRQNIVYQATDGLQNWQPRLVIHGVYDGTSFASGGREGVIWSYKMPDLTCPNNQQGCSFTTVPPTTLAVYVTRDGGVHWTTEPATSWPVEFAYFKGFEGWAISRGVQTRGSAAPVYHTTDGGATWAHIGTMPAGAEPNGYAYGVDQTPLRFADSSHGWFATSLKATPDHSGLFQTVDGGRTWVEQPISLPAKVAAYDMYVNFPIFFSSASGILPISLRSAAGADNATANLIYVLRTSDGGLTWTDPAPMLGARAAQFQPVGDVWQGFYLNSADWWVSSTSITAGDNVRSAPALARTSDGGKSWQIVRDAPFILVMQFSSAETGWALAVEGPDNTNVLLYTGDGGSHWSRLSIP